MVLTGEVAGIGELDLGTGYAGGGGIIAEEGRVGLGGRGIVAAIVDAVGGFQSVFRSVLGQRCRGKENRDKDGKDALGEIHRSII